MQQIMGGGLVTAQMGATFNSLVGRVMKRLYYPVPKGYIPKGFIIRSGYTQTRRMYGLFTYFFLGQREQYLGWLGHIEIILASCIGIIKSHEKDL